MSMAVNDSITNENGDAILISLQEPYTGVVEILGYADETIGETTSTYFNKSFRWGIDGVTYSDWSTLSNESLKGLLLTPINPFWVQYKYEQVGDGTLEFKSIALELVTDGGLIYKVPQIKCQDSDSLSGSQNLVVDCCGSTWNPYDLSRASQMYNQLSAITSNIFGFCVKYFKTESDQRSRDVILKEYSLFNVIASSDVKILIPDNALPTREIQFNPLMMDFPVQFEIHIVKSEFQKVFGVGSKPQMRDYLYFEQFMNRMYEVDAVAEADDFLYTGSYWRVSLVPYQQRTAVMYPDKNIEEEKDSIVSSVEEKFKEERNNEYDDVRKPNQYNTIGTLSNDYVRRILDKKLIIKEENIYNNWTVISKDNYQLSTMSKGAEAVEYRYDKGWTETDNRAFTFWIRPKYDNPVGQNIVITGISNSSGKAKFMTAGLPTGSSQISIGDWISVSGTNSYNSIHKVIAVGTTSIDIDTAYIDSIIQGNPRFSKESSNEFMIYETNVLPKTSLVSFVQTPNWFIIKMNNEYFKFKVKTQNLTLYKDKWYAIVINLNHIAKQLSLFIYETVQSQQAINPALTSSLNKVFNETKLYTPISVADNNAWKLLGCQLDITNIRIWKSPIEEELHDLVLSQYVVKDTHLTLLLDNASPRLLLPKETNPR
jgi:hypothetical protein